MDAVLTIAPPPRARIAPTECLMPRNTPRRHTACVLSQSSTLISSRGPTAPPMPALLPAEFGDRARHQRFNVLFLRHVGAPEDARFAPLVRLRRDVLAACRL